MAIQIGNVVKWTTQYNNLSPRDYLECHKVGSLYQIKGRRYVKIEKTELPRTFEFFFPDAQEFAQGKSVSWSGSPLMVTGRIPKMESGQLEDQSLGGPAGACVAKLNMVGNVMTGSLSCTNFVNPDDQGIGQFDFDILDLLCTIT